MATFLRFRLLLTSCVEGDNSDSFVLLSVLSSMDHTINIILHTAPQRTTSFIQQNVEVVESTIQLHMFYIVASSSSILRMLLL